MRLVSCPKPETLLELISVPDEMPRTQRLLVKLHSLGCSRCRETMASIREKCESYFRPAPDITSSLLRVYSKLQNDETLILKGWKLGELQAARPRGWNQVLFQEGWLFRGSLAMAVLMLLGTLVLTQLGETQAPPIAQTVAEKRVLSHPVPLAQIRIEDRNTVRVHYVRPELLQSVEFETTSAR